MVYARTAVVVLAGGSPESPPTPGGPSTREFVTSAGFGGALALLAAIVIALVVLGVVWRASRRHQAEREQREQHDAENQVKKDRAAEIAVVEQRFRWIVETAGIEPAASEHATLRLGPELALELLTGLLSDAQRLGDETLARGITVYLNQFSLVLAQQGGPLSQLKNGSPQPKSSVSAPAASSAATTSSTPATDPAAAGDQDAAADSDTDSVAAMTTGRRRR
jgi:hypothetical protein